jgi:hypothetical protein
MLEALNREALSHNNCLTKDSDIAWFENLRTNACVLYLGGSTFRVIQSHLVETAASSVCMLTAFGVVLSMDGNVSILWWVAFALQSAQLRL